MSIPLIRPSIALIATTLIIFQITFKGFIFQIKFGIVLGLIPITLAGLFVTSYLQYRRGDQLDL